MPKFFGETGANRSTRNTPNVGNSGFFDTLHLGALARVIAYPGSQLLKLGRRESKPRLGLNEGQGCSKPGSEPNRKQGSKQGLKEGLKEGFKLVLIGNSGSGKSSTLYRWLKGRWLGEAYGNMSTIGAAFCQSLFNYDPIEARKIGVQPVQKVDIWDTAGQERYRGMLGLYYRNADLGLLVIDLTENPEDIKSSVRTWIDEYESKSENINILLIGNKTDLFQKKTGEFSRPSSSFHASDPAAVKGRGSDPHQDPGGVGKNKAEPGGMIADDLEGTPSVRALREIASEFELPVVLLSAFNGNGIDRMVDFISQKLWEKLVFLSKIREEGNNDEDFSSEESYFLDREDPRGSREPHFPNSCFN